MGVKGKKREHKLTPRQIKFINLYDGNATEAARRAGYKGHDETLKQVGAENLAKPYILKIIQERQAKENHPLIASRQERQAFWTKVFYDTNQKMENRLRASELLGKSEADFTEKLDMNLNGSVNVNLTMPANGSEKPEDPKP